MRAAALLGAILLLLPVQSSAQEETPSLQPQRSSDFGCEDDNATACQPDPAVANPWLDDCNVAPAQPASCPETIAAFGSDQRALSIRFLVDAQNETLTDYDVNGVRVLDSLTLDTGRGKLEVRSNGILGIGDREAELLLHNDPTGLVRFKGGDGSLTFRFPGTATIHSSADGTLARLLYEGGTIGHWRAERATWVDDHQVIAEGFAALRMQPASKMPDATAQVEKGIEEGRVAAAVTLQPSQPDDINQTPQVLAYDDIDIQVRLPASAPTAQSPIRIEFSADLASGRTVVLNVAQAILGETKGDVRVRYYDLIPQGAGVVEREVAIARASGLQDILDPDDDLGRPEFWIIEDEHGLQILASVPEWSTHAITVSHVPTVKDPDVRAGLVLGVVGALVAVMALLRPWRRY